ncbi:MAG TPA: ATP-dependent Clp protease adaptor ClpS [Spirochaetota bacterium]|nr:ATP-dependent Clp protease adaptor ClpS [Spirochaetota bacterium]HOM38293.1 ATP-dependent Clp protease adaptor ClpS [Spirochaetota bacterium]HPQ48489.1 ATP-dependent Clp protease adaptor ClpS [Spirochaetota bacterium]
MATRTSKRTKISEEIKEPKLYKVIMHNDDITTMDFVVKVLIEIFNKPPYEAIEIMLFIHNNGQAIVGKYIFDIAMTKIEETHNLARENGFPLKCTIEED